MNGTMPCFYAQPQLGAAFFLKTRLRVVGYTTMAPMQTIPQQPMAQMAQPMAQPMTQPMTQPMAQPMQPAMAQAVPAVPMVMVNEVPKEPRLGSPQLPSKGSALHAYRPSLNSLDSKKAFVEVHASHVPSSIRKAVPTRTQECNSVSKIRGVVLI